MHPLLNIALGLVAVMLFVFGGCPTAASMSVSSSNSQPIVSGPSCSTDQPVVTEYEIVTQIMIQNCTRQSDTFLVSEKQVEFWNASQEFIKLYRDGEDEPFAMLSPGNRQQLPIMSGQVRWEKY